MSDSLRDRIAALIYDTVAWRSVNVPVAEEVADAVIRELNRQNLLDNPVWKWLVLNEPVIAHRYMSSLS